MDLDSAVKLSLLNIMKEGVTDVDIFNRPFELQYLKDENCFNSIKIIIENRFENAFKIINDNPEKAFDALRELKLQPIRNILAPKKTLFDFRKCAYTEPIDEIMYLTLAIMLSNKIEKERIHKKSNMVFSYRLKPSLQTETKPTYLFDYKYNYTYFRKYVSRKAKDEDIKVIVACDIANFYDRLNLHKLENTLLAVRDIDISAVILLNEFLLYWSNRDSYGIPVGSNASRILAEASLLNIDKYLMNKGVKFARYVDDYRLFAENAKQAHSWLSILVERLNQEGLFLNTSKTSIIEASKAVTTSIDQDIEEQNHDDEVAKTENFTDTEMEKSALPAIIRGYSGLIPTKFRKLSTREIINSKKLNIKEIKETQIDIDLIDPRDLLKYIRALVAFENWSELSKTCASLTRFPQFIPYYLDCIQKHHQNTTIHKDEIIKQVSELNSDQNVLEYLKISITRFLSCEYFQAKRAILDTYYSLKRADGVYLGRSILESLENLVNRDDMLEIKKDFTRADPSEKRQILKMLKKTLNMAEFNAFYKNISLNENDPWFIYICGSK